MKQASINQPLLHSLPNLLDLSIYFRVYLSKTMFMIRREIKVEFATSKELRLRAGEILARVRAGSRFIITYRGKPVALLVPVEKEEAGFSPRPYTEAWADIEQALENSAPYYPGWREALRESRRQK